MSMTNVRRILLSVVGASLLALGAGGCGGAKKAYVPVDSPLRVWEAPDEADLTPDGDETDDSGGDDTTDDGGGTASK